MNPIDVGGEATTPAGVSEAVKSTLLVVDDEPLFLMVLKDLLQSHYLVRVACSGAQALGILAIEPRPDLVLLDVLMPDMDGFEVLRRMKNDAAMREIPVIFITALRDEGSEERGLESGAVDYVHKPLKNPLVVLSRIRAQLDAKSARDMLRQNNLRLKSQVAQGADALEQAQRQLLHSEKMAAMGQLAAGIVHEINNPVSFVASNIQSLTAYLQDLLELVDAFERAAGTATALDAARALLRDKDYTFIRRDALSLLNESSDGLARVRKIVRDLKDFSRLDDQNWQWADLHAGIDSTLNIVWNEIKYHCKVTKSYGDLPNIYCLASQLNQVFMNLLVNAAQAIDKQGEIHISTACVGDAVCIRVEDNGSGISKDHLDHVFEPFFTTKPAGKGTGLGLSLSRGIVQRHHGTIKVKSESGRGSEFTIVLPIDARNHVQAHEDGCSTMRACQDENDA
ncbi:MAG: response regulator [Rhodoferax sp.]|nr:response regulator [Rhodoferax sp.]